MAMNETVPQTRLDSELQVLFHAVSSCAVTAVQQLLQQNPNLINLKGWNGHTPLHRACLSGDTAIVKILCESGADPNAQNDFNETPVHYAAKRGIPTLVHVLAKYGAKLDARDSAGKTPVHNAAETGSVYMLKYFEEQGFGFRDTDRKGFTPLHSVCSFGHLDAFKFLLRRGRSDPLQANQDGDTALHVCVKEGYAYGSWLLINMLGISCIRVKNKQGLTPVDISKQFEGSKKDGHKLLLPFLDNISKQSQGSKISGPLAAWYYSLTMPLLVYLLAVLVCENVLVDFQGPVYIGTIAYIVRSAMKSSHRLNHISRWANPIMAGCFVAGMLHTMLVFYWNIADFSKQQLIMYVVLIFNFTQLYLYYQLLKADPGTVVTSIVNEKTGRPTRLTELCESELPLDSFCTECEIVKTKVTKHCKLCDKCYYRMDHHCLFLLKCIGYNNHTRFVWFIILTCFVMSIFIVLTALWALDKYPHSEFTYSEVFFKMFWEDCWPLSMVFLNVASVIWAMSLIQFQLKVVARGHTTYFQHSASLLTPVEKMINIYYFLIGKPPFMSGLSFESPFGKAGLANKSIHNV